MRLVLFTRALRRLCLLAVLLVAAPAAAQPDACVSWPGEPRPLPRVDDRDALRARWAELRAQELTLRARELEAQAPVAAQASWRRVLCLDPADTAARAGLERTRPLRVHRPEILPDAPALLPDTDVWTALSAPLGLVTALAVAEPPPPVRSPPPARARSTSRQRIERSLDALEAQLAAARFDEALTDAERLRGEISALGGGRDLAQARLRLELAEATAQAARGDDVAARACFSRALELDPAYALDPSTTSPKLLRLLDAARAGRP